MKEITEEEAKEKVKSMFVEEVNYIDFMLGWNACVELNSIPKNPQRESSSNRFSNISEEDISEKTWGM